MLADREMFLCVSHSKDRRDLPLGSRRGMHYLEKSVCDADVLPAVFLLAKP